jgi:hypothetical protein
MNQVMVLALAAWLGVMNWMGWAYQLDPESSWSEIQRTPGILIQAPMIWFGAHAIWVLAVCRRGDSLQARTSEGITVEAPLKTGSLSYNIEVYHLEGGIRRTREVFLFTKRFDIPPCSERTGRGETEGRNNVDGVEQSQEGRRVIREGGGDR